MFFSRNVPPCPGNPEDYVLVKSKEGPYWRRKRGRVKAAQLNGTFEANVRSMKLISPAAKRVSDALRPFLTGITTGRLNVRIGGALRRSLKEKGRFLLGYLKDMELQAEHPLDGLLMTGYRISQNGSSIRLELPLERGSVKPQNRLVSHFYFEAVLLYGDVNGSMPLKTVSVESALYSIRPEAGTVCVLELPMVEEDWCLVLKISALEGNELAAHTKHYRMKVVEGLSIPEIH
jgi:hypothetical protein